MIDLKQQKEIGTEESLILITNWICDVVKLALSSHLYVN